MQPTLEELEIAEALALRNLVLTQLLQMDRAFMESLREGYEQSLRGETVSLEELRQKYGLLTEEK